MKLFIVLLLSATMFNSFCQISNNITPSHSIIVVEDLTKMTAWYQKALNLSPKEEFLIAGGTAHVLQSTNFEIELHQKERIVTRTSALSSQSPGTQIKGLFKVGFKVSDMEGWLQYLSAVKVTVPRIWTDQATGTRNFIITDPEGNIIQFFE